MLRPFCCALVLATFTLGAHAQEQAAMDVQAPDRTLGDLYFSASGGAIFPDDAEDKDFGASNDLTFHTGYNVNAALGTYLNDIFRVEGELGWRAADLDEWKISGTGSVPGFTGDVTVLTGMANVYADIPIHEKVDIYVGGGLGVAQVDVKARFAGMTTDDHDTVFAYQGMAGVGLQLSDGVTLTTGYRLWNSEDIDLEGSEHESPLIHTAEVGLRFDF